MNLKISFQERVMLGKAILSTQLPVPIEKMREQAKRLKIQNPQKEEAKILKELNREPLT